MTYCEATFARSNKNLTLCDEKATKVMSWSQDNKFFIYYLCQFHAEFFQRLEETAIIEENSENKENISKYEVFG